MLILAHRPFEKRPPYAETGPIFLCADACKAPLDHLDHTVPPQILTTSPDYLLKGYSADERIVYGTGAITQSGEIIDRALTVFENRTVSFIDARSLRNNCWQARSWRASA